MPRVLVAGKVHPAGLSLLEQAPGMIVDYVEALSEAGYVSRSLRRTPSSSGPSR